MRLPLPILRPPFAALAVVLALVVPMVSVAGPTIAVESFTERVDAEGHARVLRRQGLEASVRKSFTVGEGSGWSVHASVPSEPDARRLARELADSTGRPHAVLVTKVSEPAPAGTANHVQGAVVRTRLAAAAEVRCVYVRQLADGRRFRHRYLRLNGVEQVRIETEEGDLHVAIRVEEAVAMRAGADGTWRPADRFRALELLEGLRPEQVLQPVWAHAADGLQVHLDGEVVDASVAVPRRIQVASGTDVLDHVEVELLTLDPPRASHAPSPGGAEPSIQ